MTNDHEHRADMKAVKVKPLVWKDTGPSFSGERLSAQTIFGVEYVCLWDDRSISWSVFIWGEWKDCGDDGGLEKAKAAAQADYERRILSALDPAPDRYQEGFEAGLEAAAEVASGAWERWNGHSGIARDVTACRDIAKRIRALREDG